LKLSQYHDAQRPSIVRHRFHIMARRSSVANRREIETLPCGGDVVRFVLNLRLE
jgi:hypothetical protein